MLLSEAKEILERNGYITERIKKYRTTDKERKDAKKQQYDFVKDLNTKLCNMVPEVEKISLSGENKLTIYVTKSNGYLYYKLFEMINKDSNMIFDTRGEYSFYVKILDTPSFNQKRFYFSDSDFVDAMKEAFNLDLNDVDFSDYSEETEKLGIYIPSYDELFDIIKKGANEKRINDWAERLVNAVDFWIEKIQYGNVKNFKKSAVIKVINSIIPKIQRGDIWITNRFKLERFALETANSLARLFKIANKEINRQRGKLV